MPTDKPTLRVGAWGEESLPLQQGSATCHSRLSGTVRASPLQPRADRASARDLHVTSLKAELGRLEPVVLVLEGATEQ